MKLENKYIELIRREKRNPAPGTSEAETPINTGVSVKTDSLPIVWFNSFPLAQRYKKAKLSKAKSGWYAWFEYRHPVTGEWQMFIRKHGINRIKGINERKREADGLVGALNELLADGWSPFGFATETNELQDKNLIECLRYILTLKKSLRPRSYQHYSDTVRLFDEWLKYAGLRFILPQMLRVTHAINFGDYMLMKKKYSGKSFNNHRLNLSVFMNELINREIIQKNPFKALHKQPENTKKNLPYTASERDLLRKYFIEKNPLLGEFCQCIYFLGIRPEELMQVQLRDISISERKIMIYTGAAKNRRQEPVYMSEAMMGMIESKNIEVYPGEYFLFGKHLKITEKRWIRNRVSEMHSEVIKALKLNSDHTLYSWKHTGAKEFYLNNGKDPYKLMKHLRHTDIQSTMKYLRGLGLDYNADIQVPAF